MISDNAYNFAVISFFLSIIYIFCPFRLLIKRFVSKGDEALMSTIKYKDVALTFSTDYDKENPLTVQQGQIRLLDL